MIGSAVARVVAGALCVAALAAVVAILSGDFSDGDLRVIASSVLVAIASGTSGAGLALRERGGSGDVTLGTAVAVASGVAFALVGVGIWAEPEGDTYWRLAAAAAIVALGGAHACFVLARRRADDPDGAELASTVAVAAGAVSVAFGLLGVAEVVDDGPWQLLAVVLVVQVAATLVAPLLRRRGGPADLPAELHGIADALERARSPEEVREQAQRLRALAASRGSRRPA